MYGSICETPWMSQRPTGLHTFAMSGYNITELVDCTLFFLLGTPGYCGLGFQGRVKGTGNG